MKQTVGEQLRSARESKGLTLEDAVKATNIRRAYLQELENDHPELLNSSTQARGFLRLYASYLGIPAAPLIALWEPPKEKIDEEHIDESTQKEKPARIKLPDFSKFRAEKKEKKVDEDSEQEKKDINVSLQDAISRIPKLSQFLPGKKAEESVEELPQESTVDESLDQSDAIDGNEVREEEVKTTRSSEEILLDIGKALKERREALELTLTDIETFTNVKRMYLEAMEAGRFGELPSTVQGRGMLNNYSRFLALDESWIMDAYAKALLVKREESEKRSKKKIQPPLTVRLNIPPRIRSLLNPDLILGGIFIIALFGFIIWGGAQVFTASRPTPTDAPSISEMLQQTPTVMEMIETIEETDEPVAEATPIPGVTIAEPTPTVIATANAAPLQLYIISKDRAYLKIVSDEVELFNGRVASGDVYTFSGEEEISLLTGNGAALEVYFNQEYLGNLGNVGDVVDIAFSLDGLSTPTPSPTSTPTPDALSTEGDVMEAMEDN